MNDVFDVLSLMVKVAGLVFLINWLFRGKIWLWVYKTFFPNASPQKYWPF